jgi:elongation factor P hydroxylase
MTKNNEDEDGDLDNKKRKEIKDFAIWFNRTEKQNQEKRKKDLKRKRELEQVCTKPKPKNWTKTITPFFRMLQVDQE